MRASFIKRLILFLVRVTTCHNTFLAAPHSARGLRQEAAAKNNCCGRRERSLIGTEEAWAKLLLRRYQPPPGSAHVYTVHVRSQIGLVSSRKPRIDAAFRITSVGPSSLHWLRLIDLVWMPDTRMWWHRMSDCTRIRQGKKKYYRCFFYGRGKKTTMVVVSRLIGLLSRLFRGRQNPALRCRGVKHLGNDLVRHVSHKWKKNLA